MKKIKICGLSRPEDIEAVNLLKPEYCGFVINFPKSSRSLQPEQVRILREKLDRSVTPVGVFVNQPPELVAELLNRDVISVAQLHGQEEEAYLDALRRLTEKPVWQAFQIKTGEELQRAAGSRADFVLLDAGQGEGRTFDWSCLEDFHRPFGLAGGLNADNLPRALKTRAELLDVSGGVETDGHKDPEKIERFISLVRREGR
ncbi:MAG: phosphoribosylanthranilate isomerase [Acetatifactor sp.]